MKFLSIFCLCFTAVSVFANAGIFGGFGHDIVMEKSGEIQMVSEEVIMRPGRGRTFVDGGVEGADYMDYNCSFQLRNLTDKEVNIQVGFPLDGGDNMYVARDKEKEFTVIANHKFIAGTEKDGSYPVRYVPGDKENKFRHVFLWDMTFAPKEEKILQVSYSMTGYRGLGLTWPKPYDWKNPPKQAYVSMMEMAVVQGFGYVTATGKSWAGPIEKATFKILGLDNFEEYLTLRGALEDSPAMKRAGHKKDEMLKLLQAGQRIRVLEPSNWQESTERNRLILTLEYAPFEPGVKLELGYIFSFLPRDVDGLENLLQSLDKAEKLDAAGRKNIADIILEFYGVSRDNPNITDFLKNQAWYPAKNPPNLDDTLKAKLLELSGN